jgi:hypothetical protein
MNNSTDVFNIKELRKLILSFIIEKRCPVCGTNDKEILNQNNNYCIWCLN